MPTTILSQSCRPISKNGFKTGDIVYGGGLIRLGDEINHQAFIRGKRSFTTYFSSSHYQTWTTNNTEVNVNGEGLTVSPVLNLISKSDLEHVFNKTNITYEIPFRTSPHTRFLSIEISSHNAIHQKHHQTHADEPFLGRVSCSLYTTFTRELLDIGCKWRYQDRNLDNTLTGAFQKNLTYIPVAGGGFEVAMLVQEIPNVYDSTPTKISTGFDFLIPSDGIAHLPPTGTDPSQYDLYRSNPRALFVPPAARGTDICLILYLDYVQPVFVSVFEAYEETAL